MKQDFRKARTYYMQGLQAQAMPFQLVDSHYYLGLISFVEQDMREAQIHFQYVQQHGNRMYFKEKADSFMETILALEKRMKKLIVNRKLCKKFLFFHLHTILSLHSLRENEKMFR